MHIQESGQGRPQQERAFQYRLEANEGVSSGGRAFQLERRGGGEILGRSGLHLSQKLQRAYMARAEWARGNEVGQKVREALRHQNMRTL